VPACSSLRQDQRRAVGPGTFKHTAPRHTLVGAPIARQAWEAGSPGWGPKPRSTQGLACRTVEGAKLTDVKLLGDARRTLEQLSARRAGERAERSVTPGSPRCRQTPPGSRTRSSATMRVAGVLKLPGSTRPTSAPRCSARRRSTASGRPVLGATRPRYMPPAAPRATPGRAHPPAGTTVSLPRVNEAPASCSRPRSCR